MSELTTIDTPAKLESAFQKEASRLSFPGLNVSVESTVPGSDRGFDFLLRAEADDKAVTFAAQCKVRPSSVEVPRLLKARLPFPPLLATIRLTAPLWNQCLEQGLSCVDLNGRLHLRAPGLRVVLDRSLNRYRPATPEHDLFSPRSSRLARALLSFPDRVWTQGELAKLTGCSAGLLSRLLNEHKRHGWVHGQRGDWALLQPGPLLDAWAHADDWRKRVTIREYSALEADPGLLARRVAESGAGPLAFTQWFAARHRHQYTELPVVSVYRTRFADAAEQAALGLREVSQGGRLWIIVPRDDGVFQATRTVDGLPLACDAQIYLDLMGAGLRGPDAARALREWDGFCQP